MPPERNFLGLDGAQAELGNSSAVVIPVPYEATTSWGGGTRNGPDAILDASQFIELYDPEWDGEPSAHGVHTLSQVELTRESSTTAMEELEAEYGRILDRIDGRFPVLLGGEHSISAPAIRAQAARCDGRLSILQLDAHADLRDGYQGAPWSHAAFAYRTLDVADFVQIGLRGVSSEEVEVIRSRDGVTAIWAHEMPDDDRWMDRALAALSDPVYLTVDVDYFDPSLVPSTGTPEPGGPGWYETLRFLRRVFGEREVVGCDVVELAPVPGLHAPDFLVAKLIYKILGYRFEGGG